MERNSRRFTIILFVAGLMLVVSGFAAGVMAVELYKKGEPAALITQSQLRENAINDKGFKFINPLLGCGATVAAQSSNYTTVSKMMNDLVKTKIGAGDASIISVYLSTPDGRVIINPEEKFYPASLLKVPTMIAYLKAAEMNPTILDKKLLYTAGQNDLNSLQYFKPSKTLVSNTTYTVNDLLERLIGYSDNNAVPLLVNNIDNNKLLEVYKDLGVQLPKESNEDFVNITTYSNFFRVLYNGTYLSWDMSEKAMEMLAEHDFPQGIEAGVPKDIIVAQKFGEIDLSSNPYTPPNEVKELHDCGMVYYPNHPYILCVMTKGTNFDRLANVIQTISAAAYTNFQKLYPAVKQP